MQISRSSSWTGVSLALMAAALWGTTGTAQTMVGSQTSPYWIGALRLAVATVFFLALLALQHAPGRRVQHVWLPHSAWRWVWLAGACMAAYNLCFFAGVKSVGVAVGTALAIGSGPIWIGLLQSVVTRQAPRPVWWLGTALAIGGLTLLLGSKGWGTGPDLQGVLLCLGAGLSYATYTLTSKHLVGVASPTVATSCVFAAATLLALPLAAVVAGALTSSIATWLMVVYLGLVATGVAYLLFGHALRHISAASGVTLALGEPVTAFALAVGVLGEQPTALAYMGLGLVLGGLLLVVWIETRPDA